MHVAHFIHRFPPARGGAELYCQRLTHFLKEHGHTVTVWTSTANELPAMWQTGFAELESTESIRRFRPWRFPGRRYLFKALSLLPYPPWQAFWLPCNPVSPAMWTAAQRFEEPLDAVHAFAFPYSFLSLCAWKLACRRNVPFFLTPFLHLGDPTNPGDRTRRQYSSRPLRWLLRQADRVFVQTQAEQQVVHDLGVRTERVILQGLGVTPEECTGGDRDTVRRHWGVTDADCVIGHLANASFEKGTIDLLQATQGRVTVVLAGPEMPNFHRFWASYPHQRRVIRLGELTDVQKREFFAGIDVFALPSRSDSFGLVLLEAWANGKPNLVYRAGGPGELVRDGVDGLVVPCGDIPALANAIDRLSADAFLRQQLGVAGLARIPEFHWPDKLRIVLNQLESAKTLRSPSSIS